MPAFEIRNDLFPPSRAGTGVAQEFVETFNKLEIGQGLVYPISTTLKDPLAPYKKVALKGQRYRWWKMGEGYGAVRRTK